MFFDRYCALCKQRGLSASAAAIEMGINKGTVSVWKAKGTVPQTAQLQKISEYFGVTVDFLLGSEEKAPSADDLTFDDFTYALHNQSKELTAENKEKLLDMAKMLKLAQDAQTDK